MKGARGILAEAPPEEVQSEEERRALRLLIELVYDALQAEAAARKRPKREVN